MLPASAGPALAQTAPGFLGQRPGLADLGTLRQLQQRVATAGGPSVPLEGALDAETYVVGPGDVFNVTVGGPEPVLLRSTVTADGRLMLLESGSVEAAGAMLAEVRDRARALLRQQYRNVSLDVSLAEPRQFRVHVSGAVPVPGRYVATAVARVSDMVELAFANTEQAPVTNLAYRPSLRNVMLNRQDGTRHSVDLLRYFATGDVAHNPYLRDGDVLYVQAYDPDEQAVFIDGAIPFPGTYPYRPDDTALDLLMLAAGETSLAALGEVRLTRVREDGQAEDQIVAVADLLAGEAVPVQPLDHLYVMPKQLLSGTATVTGAVRFPGTYPITLGRTTLRDLVRFAGGPREDALTRAAFLQRNPLAGFEETASVPNRFEQMPLTDRFLGADTVSVLQRTRLAELSFLSRAYFAQELRQASGLLVDLGAALAPESEPIYLQDGDRLRVPRDEQTVLVMGQVVRPGYTAFMAEWPAERYIQEAGGRGPEATEAYLVKAGTGQFLPLGRAEVESGDIVFVDRREGVADTPQMQRLLLEVQRTRADARSRVAQIVFSTIATTATVITTYLFIRRSR